MFALKPDQDFYLCFFYKKSVSYSQEKFHAHIEKSPEMAEQNENSLTARVVQLQRDQLDITNELAELDRSTYEDIENLKVQLIFVHSMVMMLFHAFNLDRNC